MGGPNMNIRADWTSFRSLAKTDTFLRFILFHVTLNEIPMMKVQRCKNSLRQTDYFIKRDDI